MKRVYCLYRVSTLGQVEKDDIPMQRQACHAFAEKQGWQIIAEFSEKGVSGFKQSAEQREALVAIKQAAILKKFDVLLVFMFDRLGRRDDETPFVVEWFVKNGIAVWSVMEGEQRFENHVDKLLNYIRFWQSSGESIKTALRTRVRMEQLIQENGYVGGTAPYGYRLCKLGRVNKRGFEVHDLLMDPAKAEVIKTIFRLYCEEDMGPYKQTDEAAMAEAISDIMDICAVTQNKHLLWFRRILDEHFEGIIAHASFNISAGRIEGINNKIKTLRRKGYGYPDDDYFFLKLFDISRKPYIRNPSSHNFYD